MAPNKIHPLPPLPPRPARGTVPLPTIRPVPLGAPLAWLALGWRDLWRCGPWGLLHGLVLAMQEERQHPWVQLPYPLRVLALPLMSPLMHPRIFLLAFHLLLQQRKGGATTAADQAVAFCFAPAAKPEAVRHLFHSCRGAAR